MLPEMDEFGITTEEETFVYESDILQARGRWVHANDSSATPLTNLRKFKKMLRALELYRETDVWSMVNEHIIYGFAIASIVDFKISLC